MKLKSLHRCQQCGHTSPKWLGQCPGCEAWNTLVEEVVEVRPAAKGAPARQLTDFSSGLKRLSEIDENEERRIPIGLAELDRLLGGGLLRGQVALLAGPPGIGKSTLMLQAAASLARPRGGPARKILYVSGEESLGQVSGRARRLAVAADDLYLASETDLGKVLEALETVSPEVLVLDSIQTVYHPDLVGSPGSVGQVRECAAELLRAAKSKGVIVFLLGHVTKEGSLAGPKVLEHIVDTVLSFDTESHGLLRVLRVQKNRFGPASEIALFEMGEKGLAEVADASAFFVSEGGTTALPGRAVSVAMEGSRPMLVEVQALVSPTRYPLPRRMATGLDLNRTLVLIAALEKHLRLRLENRDVFISLAGGMRQKDPALDLAVCMAVVSSARDVALPQDRVFIGEVGLLGNVGRVPFLAQRLKEAEKMGYDGAYAPARSLKELKGKAALTVEAVADIAACAAKAAGADRSAPEAADDLDVEPMVSEETL